MNQFSPKPLRLWPGVLLAAVTVFRFIVPVVAPDGFVFDVPLAVLAMLGGVGGGLLIVMWWLFFSRAPWFERIGALILIVVSLFATWRVVHPSIYGGHQGMTLPLYSIPVLGLAMVIAAVVTRQSTAARRRVTMTAAILLSFGVFTLLRTGGVMGAGSELHWRWTPTPEQRLLSQANDDPAPVPAAGLSEIPPPTPSAPSPRVETPKDAPAPVPATPPPAKAEPVASAAMHVRAEWPGFRGPQRDGVVHGVRIETDWSKSPPVQLWRQPIGPGWSSFAVAGDRIYTQEQRGEDEIVASYSLTTGKPVWRHRDHVRFYESNGGAGPRGTPALSGNRVYAMGATGVLNALNAQDGSVIWSHNAATDTGRQIPDWGIASSPLVIDDLVIVGVSGTLTAYDAATGKPRWTGPQHGGSYSSPHLVTLDGVEQILLMTGAGVTSVAPATGAMLWEHAWPGSTIVQPAVTADGDLLITTGDAMGGNGTRRLAVRRAAGGWTVEERWTSRGLKPYFNDFVVHKGYAFGFDGAILSCIDLKDGERKWKGGRYGNGQLVLLADDDVLLVLSEEGELALVSATPDQFKELARFPALDGKTWNHPVLVGDVLLVRNGEEMAAFRVARADN